MIATANDLETDQSLSKRALWAWQAAEAERAEQKRLDEAWADWLAGEVARIILSACYDLQGNLHSDTQIVLPITNISRPELPLQFPVELLTGKIPTAVHSVFSPCSAAFAASLHSLIQAAIASAVPSCCATSAVFTDLQEHERTPMFSSPIEHADPDQLSPGSHLDDNGNESVPDDYEGTITIDDTDYEVLARSVYQGCAVVTYAYHANGERLVGMIVERAGLAVIV